MTEYDYKYSKSAKKFLKKHDKITNDRIEEAVEKLAINPYAYTGVTKLGGFENTYRISVGKYRIAYEIRNNVLLIMVLTIDSRGSVYDKLQSKKS